MDRFLAMQVFTRVAELESFSAAARQLSLSKSAVSKQISALEDALGARLLNRTTRKLSLTEAGQGYYQWAQRILNDVEEAERLVGSGRVRARGRLKVSAPMSFGFRHLAPLLPKFMEAYPELELELSLSDRFVDMVAEGQDVALRIGLLQDTSLIARKVSQTRRVLCGSPAYFQANGRPTHPEALSSHQCLTYSHGGRPSPWRFRDRDGKELSFTTKSRLNVDNGDALLALALGGAGIAQMPAFLIWQDIKAGRLEVVLSDYEQEPLPISALYPSGRNLSAKVRAFIDFVDQEFGPAPPWDSM